MAATCPRSAAEQIRAAASTSRPAEAQVAANKTPSAAANPSPDTIRVSPATVTGIEEGREKQSKGEKKKRRLLSPEFAVEPATARLCRYCGL